MIDNVKTCTTHSNDRNTSPGNAVRTLSVRSCNRIQTEALSIIATPSYHPGNSQNLHPRTGLISPMFSGMILSPLDRKNRSPDPTDDDPLVMILVEGGPEFGSMFGLSVKIRPDRVGEFLFRS